MVETKFTIAGQLSVTLGKQVARWEKGTGMAMQVKISRVESIKPDCGGFHIVLVSGTKRIELFASRHVLLAGVEMARLILAEAACDVIPLHHA